MRILFVTPYVPSKVRVRPYAFIRELSQLGHEIHLVCLIQPNWEISYLDGVRPFCHAVHPIFQKKLEPIWRIISSLPTYTPFSVAYCQTSELNQKIFELLTQEKFDLVHTEFIRAAPATVDLQHSVKVFDSVDSMTLSNNRGFRSPMVPLKQRIICFFEWSKMRFYEPRIIKKYDQIFASSEMDRLELEKSSVPVTVLTNGVDLDYFHFSSDNRDTDTIVFLGKMSYYVNVASVLWFYDNVFPIIRKNRPGIKFKIIGRNPLPQITHLTEDPAVTVTGTVQDVREYLSSATVSVCPMVSGSGIQNKMLEAMSMGIPCVSTSLASHGLYVNESQHLLIADSAQDFAYATLELLNHPEKRQEISANARKYVEQNHNWHTIGFKLDQIYTTLLDAKITKSDVLQ